MESQAAATRTNLLVVPPQAVLLELALLVLRQEVPLLVEPLELVPLVAKMVEQEALLASLQAPQVLQALHLLSQEMLPTNQRLPTNQLLQVEMQKATQLQ